MLGLLFFIIFINDICQSLNSERLLYVDDCELFRRVVSAEDSWSLQDDTDALIGFYLP